MNAHLFVNSNPAGFDSNCSVCGGKHRDSVHGAFDSSARFAATVPPETPYIVFDSKTGKTVYRTTYKNRNRARRWADRKDLEYGAVRYLATFPSIRNHWNTPTT